MTQLHPHHVLLYHARDLVKILKANPDEAAYPTELADYAEACAKACEAELSPFHPTVAHMYKMVGDSFASKDSHKASIAYGKAAQSLAISYGATHPTVLELAACASSNKH